MTLTKQNQTATQAAPTTAQRDRTATQDDQTAAQPGSVRAWMLDCWDRHTAEVSGDFVVTRSYPDALRIFLGDVTGHGVKAAAAARDAQAMIERDADGPISVDTLQSWGAQFDALHPDRFVCLTYVEINFLTRKVIIANAGNPPLIVRRPRNTGQGEYGRVDEHAGSGECRRSTFTAGLDEYPSTGMPLGMVEAECWIAPSFEQIDLSADDQIVCFTDGLPDQEGPSQQRVGLERVLSTIATAGGDSTLRSLNALVDAFADRDADQDDVTVVSIAPAARHAA